MHIAYKLYTHKLFCHLKTCGFPQVETQENRVKLKINSQNWELKWSMNVALFVIYDLGSTEMKKELKKY